jgi:hypothetical protein
LACGAVAHDGIGEIGEGRLDQRQYPAGSAANLLLDVLGQNELAGPCRRFLAEPCVAEGELREPFSLDVIFDATAIDRIVVIGARDGAKRLVFRGGVTGDLRLALAA